MAENTPPTMTRKRIVSGGKRYCALCSHYENQTLDDGFRVTLHCLPGGQSNSEKSRRKAWLRGIKLHRPNYNVTSSTRICCLHFENRQCVRGESVPKYYNLSHKKVGKVRRPLVKHALDANNNEVNDLMDETVLEFDDESEVFYATKLDNFFLPDEFTDDIDSCAVVEVKDVKLCYREEELVPVTEEHCYSKGPVCSYAQTNDAECQTLASGSGGGYKPENILDNSDINTRFYTGFPTFSVFMLFFNTFMKHGADKLNYWEGQKRTLSSGECVRDENRGKPGRRRKLRPIDEFFMVCIRLRLGLLQQHLGDLFCVSQMTVSRVMNTWINFMYDHMKGLIPWPTKQQILANLPKSFQGIPDSRIVIDATEFFCEKPSSLKAQNLTWSEYKHHNTFKVLVGVAPNGLVTFLSSVWGGHTSDRHITQEDGHLLIPRLEPNDVILADKGFTVADLLPADIGLNMPPFISKSKQMTKQEFFKTQQIASSRIVVEMKMEQIKNFKVLQTVLPISEAHLAEQMIVICTAMTNLYEPLLKY